MSSHRPNDARSGRRSPGQTLPVALAVVVVAAAVAVGSFEIWRATSAKPAVNQLVPGAAASGTSAPSRATVMVGHVTTVQADAIGIVLFKSSQTATVHPDAATTTVRLVPGSGRSAAVGTHVVAMLGQLSGNQYAGAKELLVGPADVVDVFAGQVPVGSAVGAVSARSGGVLTVTERDGTQVQVDTGRLLSTMQVAAARPADAVAGDLLIASGSPGGDGLASVTKMIIAPAAGLGGENHG